MNTKSLRNSISFAYLFVFFLAFQTRANLACGEFYQSERERQTKLYESLHKAMRDDYVVQVFTKMVNGQEKKLVLMGETHIKNKESAAIGRDVINNFDYVGREGYEAGKTWGDKFKAKVFTPAISKLGIKDQPQFWIARAIGKLFGKGGRTEDSTIAEAQVAEFRNQIIQNLKETSPEKLNELITALEKEPENLDGKMSIGDITIFTVREFLEMAKLASQNKDLPKAKGPKETFHLEAGHKPDVWENIHSIENYVTYGIIAGYYAASSFIPQQHAHAAAIAINAFSLYQISGMGLMFTKYHTSPWFQKLFPLNLAILRGRNATMVRNIETTFNDRSDVNEMLAIVGKLHVPEMKQLLERMGYTSIALPSPTQMQAQDKFDSMVTP